jgi:hypothetical protein
LEVRTGDTETGIGRIFDADKVHKDINAQVQITQTFGQQASKAVGDFAESQMKEATSLRAEASGTTDAERRAALEAQAAALESAWGEQGVMRLAAHTVIGGLTGGPGGAMGAAAGTVTAPLVAEELSKAGIEGPLAQALTALASTGVGAAAGGVTGAGAALNEVANNYLDHRRPSLMHLSEKERYERAAKECEGGNTEACRTRDELAVLSQQRDRQLRQACDSADVALCNTLQREAIAMGNRILINAAGTFANSPTAFALNTQFLSAPPDPRQGSFHDTAARSTAEALLLAGAGAGARTLSSAWTAASTPGKVALGGSASAGFDAAGQLVNGGDYRLGQTLVAAGTGMLAAPFASTNIFWNASLGGAVGATNTYINNAMYGEEENVRDSFLYGFGFSGLGTGLGSLATSWSRSVLPPRVGGNPINPSIPILFQNIGKPNPWPGYIGTAIEQGISNIPAVLPRDTKATNGGKP